MIKTRTFFLLAIALLFSSCGSDSEDDSFSPIFTRSNTLKQEVEKIIKSELSLSQGYGIGGDDATQSISPSKPYKNYMISLFYADDEEWDNFSESFSSKIQKFVKIQRCKLFKLGEHLAGPENIMQQTYFSYSKEGTTGSMVITLSSNGKNREVSIIVFEQ